MKAKTCCCAGHRFKSFSFLDDETHEDCIKLKELLKEQIVGLIENFNVQHFISGMALAVDQWYAETVLDLKDKYKEITLECALPCETQAIKWTINQCARYYNIIAKCDKETMLASRYTQGCMMKRNRYMVDKSDYVLAIWNGQKHGGTYRTISYANEKRKKIIIINPLDLKVIPDI